MSNYIGVRCPVCSKKFASTDDIVVCPVCGAPHHRHCYAEKNQCAFVADHLSGKEWQAAPDPAASGTQQDPAFPATKICSRCGAVNPQESIFCQACGNPLTFRQEQQPAQAQAPPQQEQPWPFGFQANQAPLDSMSMQYGGLRAEDDIDGETVVDVAKYVGSNSAYYLPRFKIMSETNRTLSTNLAAFIFNFGFYFYRKMYLIGTVLMLLFVVSIIPTYLYTYEVLPRMLYQFGLGPDVAINMAAAEHFLNLSNMTRTINFFIGMIFSLCANRFYYNKSITAVNSIRTQAQNAVPPQEYTSKLGQAGGCNKAAVSAVIATFLVGHLILSLIMGYLIM